MPAQFTRICRPPSRSTVWSMEERTAASRVTSHSRKSALPPAASIPAATCRPSSAWMSRRATAAPSCAKRRAIPAPIPDAAPLIQAVWPSSRFIVASAPGANVCGRLPARDGRLQRLLDPEELAVHRAALLRSQPENQLRRLFRRIAAGLFHPLDPLLITRVLRAEP